MYPMRAASRRDAVRRVAGTVTKTMICRQAPYQGRYTSPGMAREVNTAGSCRTNS